MAKAKHINETDFDFSKVPKKEPSYFWERFLVTFFITGFTTLFLLTPSIPHIKGNVDLPPPIQYEPFYDYQDSLPAQYPDYIVTPEDKKMFETIFSYDKSSTLSKDDYTKFLQEQIKNADLSYGSFNNKQKFDVTSTILAIEPSDKAKMIGEKGNPDLDYVDLVIQKEFTQNKQSYYEQQMVSVTLDKHKIVSMTTNRMID